MRGFQFGLGAFAGSDVADGGDGHERASALVVDEAAAVTEDALPAGLGVSDAHIEIAQVLPSEDARKRPSLHWKERAIHVGEFEYGRKLIQMTQGLVQLGES